MNMEMPYLNQIIRPQEDKCEKDWPELLLVRSQLVELYKHATSTVMKSTTTSGYPMVDLN